MNIPKSFGFPRMMKEAGEKRVFLPEFIQFIAACGAEVFIEEGYGSSSGYTFYDYLQSNPAVHICSRQEAFQQEMVMLLRSPKLDEFDLLKPGNGLFSMLHFPTRPKRVAKLQELDIHAISMDSIVNDNNRRLIEDMKAVAWNGLEVAFDVLEKQGPSLIQSGKPTRVLVLGSGMVGRHAVEAATKLGNIERNTLHIQEQGPGSIAVAVGRNISGNAVEMEKLFRQIDILVDATQRRDSSRPVIPNDWLDWLPQHAVIVDLSVDPYTLDAEPPVVRGIEGIPKGDLEQYVFVPDAPGWEETVPASISSRHRRTVVSCYSWPGLHPEASMRHYAQQLEPLIEALMTKGYDGVSLSGSYFERALYRGTLRFWLAQANRRLLRSS